jgi:hypothetical protein
MSTDNERKLPSKKHAEHASDEQSSHMSILEKMKAGKRKQHEGTSMIHEEFMDADFILAYAAIVERLWSLASHILTDTQTNDTNCF